MHFGNVAKLRISVGARCEKRRRYTSCLLTSFNDFIQRKYNAIRFTRMYSFDLRNKGKIESIIRNVRLRERTSDQESDLEI